MATKIIHVCDVCGAEKKRANHWWRLRLVDDGRPHPALEISNFEDSDTLIDKLACGELHVSVLVSRFLDHGDLEEVKV